MDTTSDHTKDSAEAGVIAPGAIEAQDELQDIEANSTLYLYPPSRDPGQLHPLVLAYIGDAVFEVFVRQYVISQKNHRPHHLHRLSTRFVSAKAQAKALQELLPELTQEELDIVKRGRNAKSGTSPKNTDILVYRHSTAFECLVGYLYYTQQFARLRRLVELVIGAEGESREDV